MLLQALKPIINEAIAVADKTRLVDVNLAVMVSCLPNLSGFTKQFWNFFICLAMLLMN